MAKGFRSKAAPTKNELAQASMEAAKFQGEAIERLQQQVKFAINSTMQTMGKVNQVEGLINSTTSLLRMVEKTTAAETGDAVMIDFIGYLYKEDGTLEEEAFDGSYAIGHVLMNLGSSGFLKEFEGAILGKAAGSELTVDLTFPAEYHEKLKNKKAHFLISVVKVWTDAPGSTYVANALEKSSLLKAARLEAEKAASAPKTEPATAAPQA